MSELLEKILDKRNMNEAYKKVCANKGAGGVDGMGLSELDGYIRENWDSIREQIRKRSYKPQPVRRVEIPKPDGSKRNLGIPTVMDRVIQQGIVQIISPMCEPLFSESSYGFRPNRSCEMAIRDMLMFPTMKSLDAKKSDGKAEKAASLESALGQASQALVQQLEAMPAAVAAPQLDLSKVKIEPLFEDFVDFETFAKSDFRVVKIEACEAVPKSKKLLKFMLNDGSDRKRTILSGIHEYYEPEELVGKTCVAITNLPTRVMMGVPSEGMLISAVYEYDGREGLNLLMLDDVIPAGAKLY